ncbi:MAG TPA: RNA polymerase sigma factor [Candidatus Eisenbacteria bacterium]|jgi:RNA polymerase sigma-70 factor (ECF subfamily)|nr:RNA polymerase sigma factor [Candidatus Eisenbacteria bacterium]
MAQARPDRSAESDGELVRLILAGEADAFAELVRRTQRSGYRLARRITRNHEDADDVLQESYAKAYRALDRFAPDRPFGPWFLTIVARTALSWIRDSKRRSAVSLDEPGADGSAPLADKVADPAYDAIAVERRSRVERAFAKLSEDHRMVLSMRVEGDLSYAAIAEALSIPVGTVMSRLARAREALVEILNEMKEAEPK